MSVDALLHTGFDVYGYFRIQNKYDIAVVVRAIYRHIALDKSVKRGLSRVVKGVAACIAADKCVLAGDRV